MAVLQQGKHACTLNKPNIPWDCLDKVESQEKSFQVSVFSV